MKLEPMNDGFVCRVHGLDLDRELTRAARATVQDAIDRFAVLVIPGQALDDAALVRFAEGFGELEVPLPFDQYGGADSRITRLANVDEADRVMAPDSHHATYMRGNLLWHTDSSFKPVPAKYSLLHAREIPARGGETEFADARAAYDDWVAANEDAEALEPLVCEHSIVWSRSLIIGDFFSDEEKARMPPVRQRLVRRHPATGRRNFYAGSHAAQIEGWPIERGRAFIARLNEFLAQRRYVHTHEWRIGDLVMWDNRCVLHRGLPYDPHERRVMHRATVKGDGSSLEAG